MSGYQHITVIGNLGRNPEIRNTQGGTAVCTFSVACNEKRGETEHTEWFNVVVFGASGEACYKHLAKGRQCLVAGRMQTRKYQPDQEVPARYFTELIADRVQFLGGKDQGKPSDDDDGGIPF